MKLEAISRHLREAYRGVRRNTWMSFAAISVVAVTLFIFGIFLVVAFNIRFMAAELSRQVAIMVSLNPQLTPQQQREIEKEFQNMPGVKSAKFTSKEQGLKEMKEQLGDKGKEFFKGMDKEGENPLPDVIQVLPKDPQKIEQLAEKFKKMDSRIEDVDFNRAVAKKILGFYSWIQHLVLIFGLALAVLSAFLISNTIKLTIIARKEEVEIQRLVGASDWFIRWPFLFEGVFIGLGGAVVPTMMVLLLYKVALMTLQSGSESITIFMMLPMGSLALYVGGSLFLLGAVIGMMGSMISIRRFLRV